MQIKDILKAVTKEMLDYEIKKTSFTKEFLEKVPVPAQSVYTYSDINSVLGRNHLVVEEDWDGERVTLVKDLMKHPNNLCIKYNSNGSLVCFKDMLVDGENKTIILC